ncbi:MAG TPA: hypothetical protein VMI75_09010 [Polyangiaceae bacterium]|nr:hypothetical protein [Polyangiaceae bacterium]
MKVDRSLFHVFTGVIAASAVACVVKEYQPPPPPPPAPPPPAAQTPAQPQAPSAANPHIRPLHEGQASNTPSAPPHILPIGPHPGPTPAPTPNPPAPAPGACLDQGGITAPTCSASLTSSCSGNAFPMQRCQAYLQYFDPKVGANAIACMNGLGANMCDAQHDYDCGKAALAKACPDNTTAQLCQIAAGPCKVSSSDCVSMLSGLSSAGQDAVAQCVAGGCSAGLYSCIEGLGATASGHH